MGKLNVEIMTYEPYWYECDRCQFKTDKYESLAQLTLAIAKHQHITYVVERKGRPAPMKPSEFYKSIGGSV
jgi:hypothetical protein